MGPTTRSASEHEPATDAEEPEAVPRQHEEQHNTSGDDLARSQGMHAKLKRPKGKTRRSHSPSSSDETDEEEDRPSPSKGKGKKRSPGKARGKRRSPSPADTSPESGDDSSTPYGMEAWSQMNSFANETPSLELTPPENQLTNEQWQSFVREFMFRIRMSPFNELTSALLGRPDREDALMPTGRRLEQLQKAAFLAVYKAVKLIKEL
eukprot:scaffold913_cov431-Prasinococcus_capsulatus_cf.AAC.2